MAQYILENYVGDGPLTCAGCPTNIAPFRNPVAKANRMEGQGGHTLQPHRFASVAPLYTKTDISVAPFQRPREFRPTAKPGSMQGMGEVIPPEKSEHSMHLAVAVLAGLGLGMFLSRRR